MYVNKWDKLNRPITSIEGGHDAISHRLLKCLLQDLTYQIRFDFKHCGHIVPSQSLLLPPSVGFLGWPYHLAYIEV